MYLRDSGASLSASDLTRKDSWRGRLAVFVGAPDYSPQGYLCDLYKK